MLSASADAAAADWVLAGIRDFDSTVGSIVPAVFDDYARVFHPASRGSGADTVAVRWAEVAVANGRVMHPTAEWGSLTGSWASGDQPGLWDQPPRTGELPAALAKRLAVVLAKHTRRSERCCFALWDGWGTAMSTLMFRKGTPEEVQLQARQTVEAQIAAWRELIENAASFTLPERDMRLLRGPLAATEDFYELHRNPPSLWWPEDRTWCVGTDIDLMTTYLGGSNACIEAVLADEQLEGLQVSADQCVTWDADTINPLPAPP